MAKILMDDHRPAQERGALLIDLVESATVPLEARNFLQNVVDRGRDQFLLDRPRNGT